MAIANVSVADSEFGTHSLAKLVAYPIRLTIQLRPRIVVGTLSCLFKFVKDHVVRAYELPDINSSAANEIDICTLQSGNS